MKCFSVFGLTTLLAIQWMPSISLGETVVDFQELTDFDDTILSFDGSELPGGGDVYNGYAFGAPTGSFSSKGAVFGTQEFGPGFSYSRFVDSTTPGFRNLFTAMPGGGSDGMGNAVAGETYGMIATGSETLADGTPISFATINFERAAMLTSLDVANSTYAFQYFANGLDGLGNPDFNPLDQFSDGDFLRLRIEGFDGQDRSGKSVGEIEVDLANYGGAGTADDQFLDGWTEIDLTSLGEARSLSFSLTSSQISEFADPITNEPRFFSDVPAFLAIDNLTFVTAIPEPTTAGVLWISSLALISLRRHRKRSGSLRRSNSTKF